VLIAVEILFILLLAGMLFMLFKNEGVSLKNGFRRAKIENCWSGTNRRQHPRFTHSMEVAYSIVKKNQSKNSHGKTVDISEGGIKLVLDEKLPPGTFVNLKIAIPSARGPAELSGEIMWTEDAPGITDPSNKRFFYSGVKFYSPKEPAGKPLIDFIHSLAPSVER
jgi:hypothetical protein